MQRIIVPDTSCLILLQKLNRLDILRDLFKEIKITETIEKEFGEKLPNFFNKIDPKNKNYQSKSKDRL